MSILEPSSAQELRAHYAAVKARLYKRDEDKPKPIIIAPKKQCVRSISEQQPKTRQQALIEAFATLTPVEDIQSHCSTDVIVRAVARRYKVLAADILGNGRQRYIVRPRSIAMYLAWENRGLMSIIQLARLFNRDHATVITAYRRVVKNWDVYAEGAEAIGKELKIGFQSLRPPSGC
jgi:chromosomal replication initiation ATPase DnaA